MPGLGIGDQIAAELPMKFLKKIFDPGSWEKQDGVSRRVYKSYDDYVEHQKAKLATVGNPQRKRDRLRNALRERLEACPEVKRGSNALCLAARFGGECEAFVDRGSFAVGIDLNPGPENRFVVTGDFHHIQFADASIDCVFTNSLDHVYEFDRVMKEVRRVLKPDGIFIAEIAQGSADEHQHDAGEYESYWWDSTETLVSRIRDSGFELVRQTGFSVPRNGLHAVFRQTGAV